ncbi:hypothetical protein [Rhizobium sp. MHM7A]|uniref:hypothetical protein n=1 Tax=Rhizobium sp. MHM7A TaxID=2583233 RepID=UPI0011061CC0|nr:hypothetical protein [Rhizobium sp. MHM7A]TLX12106.1 hypothetical protein FFR93_16180 [Rhizobium sp. MHM7A]
MTESKHTPGPWHVDPKSPEESFFEDVNVLRHDGLAIAVCVHNGDILPPEPEANARLIAAAPDLLEALKEFASMPCETDGAEDLEGGCCRTCRARAAIAKAESSSASLVAAE